MEKKQRDELLGIEAIQRSQFQEFTNAWDDYMSQYESTALHSIERLKNDQENEIFMLRQQFENSPQRFARSKKLSQYRALENKHFTTKNYDGATYFKYLADELQEFEKLTQREKGEQSYER